MMWVIEGPSTPFLRNYNCEYSIDTGKLILLKSFCIDYDEKLINELKLIENKYIWSKPRYLLNEEPKESEKIKNGLYKTNYININCCCQKPFFKITNLEKDYKINNYFIKDNKYYSCYNNLIDNKLILTEFEINLYNEKNNYKKNSSKCKKECEESDDDIINNDSFFDYNGFDNEDY